MLGVVASGGPSKANLESAEALYKSDLNIYLYYFGGSLL